MGPVIEICPACRQRTQELIGPVTEWSMEPPLVDAAEYRLWRCTVCGYEVKRKDDGTATRDPRYGFTLTELT